MVQAAVPAPRRLQAAGAGLLVSVLPVTVLAGLIAAGALPLGAGLGAAAVVWAGSTLAAWVWLDDLFRLETGQAPRWWPGRALAAGLQAQGLQRAAEAAQQAGLPSSDRSIIEALPDPLLVLSEDRAVAYANPAAREALGRELSAVLRHPTLRGALDRAQGGGHRVQTVELLLPVPVPRELHATVIDLGQAASGVRTAVVFADRTQARAVERMRADFVANASHELRTPLASLVGFIDTLRGPAADDYPAQQRFLGIMADQAARMNRLIDDLLSLSRIELTEHLPPGERIALTDVIARTLSAFEPRRASHEAVLRQELEPGAGAVLGDADQLEQVLQNLLDNALKYGRPGGAIVLGLHAAAGGRWPARPGVVLSVRDQGQGIARVHLPRLTERFYRADRGRSRAAGGTGLGLAIVKHIVNRHRGQLAIDSEEGVGSTFSIWLPVAS